MEIDFDSDEYKEVIFSQYSTSPRFGRLLKHYADVLDISSDIKNYYAHIWNVTSADGYGLDIWARIVGVSRTIYYDGPSPEDQEILWGYKGSNLQNYEHGNFYDKDNRITTSNITLGDTSFRKMIMAKAAYNITDGSMADMSRILAEVFKEYGTGFYVFNEGGNQYKVNIITTFTIPFVLKVILEYGNLLPVPAGVGYLIEERLPENFGFEGTGTPWDNGTFNE